MEVNVTPASGDKKARKKKATPSEWKRAKEKRLRYSAHFLPVFPVCGHKTVAFDCVSLTMMEIRNFHSKFYNKKDKVIQDNFILQYCKVLPVKRKRPKNARHDDKKFQGKFYVLSSNKNLVPVCKNAFMGILGITRRRIDTVMKNFYKTSVPAAENRGGDRKTEKYREKKESVMLFINKFKAIESHYCRGQNSERLYLDSRLNIKKMWKMYLAENATIPVKEAFFRNIFNTCYNLGFGTPRTDVCSTCLQLTEKIKTCKDEELKTTLATEKRVHKMRAKAYYELLRQNSEGMITFSFDCQKNQVMPKVPDQQAYYSRQVYMYNFTVVQGTSKSKLNPSSVKCFTWTENEFSKGSNEISSCIHHILETTDFSGIHTVRLMCDGCGGQNKNTTLVGMCCSWLSNQNIDGVSKIEIIFPVRGHSFIPPDRVFGHIEVECRKMEIILKPQEYLDIFGKYGTVLTVGGEDGVQIYDWKTEMGKIIKTPGTWHFAFSKSKRMIITKHRHGDILVCGETAYKSSLGVPKSICKRGKNLRDIKPTVIPKRNIINPKKKSDVDVLLVAHYGEKWRDNEDLGFYQFVIDDAEEQDEAPERLCENIDDGPDVAI